MMVRAFLAVTIFLLAPLAADAAERITEFDIVIEVEQDGDIIVTEKISVVSEGNQIRRGIFRDLPRFFLKDGRRLPYAYKVRSIRRDDASEPHTIEKVGNAYRIRIGDADVFLPNGPHTYHIVYEVKNQVRYFDSYDEIYWNATGNYWAFQIDQVRASITLPADAAIRQHAGYTGREGATGHDYIYSFQNGAHVFETTRPFTASEGLTVSIGFAKGVIDPPSAGDARAEWWTVNASRVVLTFGFLIVGFYYLLTFNKVGRDPPKGPVFARYEPPVGYTPAAVHHIYHRGVKGHDALISTLMNLATKGRIRIDVEDKKKTTITHLKDGDPEEIGEAENDLLESLCSTGQSFSFGDKYNATLTGVYAGFKNKIIKSYGEPYFRWNRGFLVTALILSGVSIFLAFKLSLAWTGFHTGAVIILLLMAAAASYFLPAPTPKGQNVRTEIEGFRLYLKTAEELQMNAVEVGDGATPLMTVERYERFLPYAVALGVEKPWTKHFEKLMPREAEDYQPHWGHSNYSGGRSLSALNSALVSGISSGVSSSLPQSSGSSGSGGGGSSGGGGGGGGGGGW